MLGTAKVVAFSIISDKQISLGSLYFDGLVFPDYFKFLANLIFEQLPEKAKEWPQ